MALLTADIAAERRADRRSYLLVAVFVVLSWVTLSISSQIEAIQDETGEPALQFWFIQFTSHAIILIMALLIPVMLSRFPFTRDTWQRALTAYGLSFLAFGIVHILAMVALRKLFWPLLLDGSYDFGLDDPLTWFYELQKDAYTFVLLTSIFWLGRHHERQRLEAEGRNQDAREHGRLTLNSGGRIRLVEADQVVLARSASNYVEIHLSDKQLLVRMTLSELERLLASAGDNHIRIHRSCLVHKGSITELKPTGDGAAALLLTNGETLKVSRSYRAALEASLTA